MTEQAHADTQGIARNLREAANALVAATPAGQRDQLLQPFSDAGPVFVIELDNSGGNHIHSVWRDFQGAWGRDILGEHYRNARGTEHKH